MERSDKMQIISYSPYCINYAGHYFPYYSTLASICKKLGWGYTVFAAKNHTLNEDLKWEKWFSSSTKKKNSFYLRFLDYKAHHYTKIPNQREIILLDSYTITDLMAFCFASALAKTNRELIFFIRDDKFISSFKKKDQVLAFIRKIIFSISLSFLKRIYKNHVYFVTDSEILRDVWSQKISRQLHLLPIPHTTHLSDIKKTTDDRLIFWIPGNPDPLRGKNAAIAFSKLIANSDAQLYISEEYQAWIPPSKNIHYLPSYIEEQKYAKLMKDSDYVLLFYHPFVFSSRTSGIFVEAIYAGNKVIVFEKSWASYELRKYQLNELIISPNEIKAELIEKLKKFQNCPNIKSKLKNIHTEYQKFHNINSFQNHFKELLTRDTTY